MITANQLTENDQIVISETDRFKVSVSRTREALLNTLGFDKWTVAVLDKQSRLNTGFMYKDTFAGAMELARDYASQMGYPQMEERKERKD